MDISEKSLLLHERLKGKIEITSRADVKTREGLSTAYTPGVAAPCLRIKDNPDLSYTYTRRGNLVAVVTDGSAVLGLGDIGPEAAMPVMEGKCVLFKEFGGVDAFPVCIDSKDPDVITDTVCLISKSFGGINLEDISAPRCFEIENKLKKRLDIPVFHDDQHGTAIIVLAGIINALKVVGKNISEVKIVVNGPGAAGTAIINLLADYGARHFCILDERGMLYPEREDKEPHKTELAKRFNPSGAKGDLSSALIGADIFIGVSKGNLLSADDISKMNNDAIIFAMANPTPEINPDDAKRAGAKVVGTGRSDYPNQVNNVLAFPGVFRGALDTRSRSINREMKIAAAEALSALVSGDELSADYILPAPFDPRVKDAVAAAVSKAAVDSGVARVKP